MDPLTAALAEIESNGGLEKTESVKSGMCSVFDNILYVLFDNLVKYYDRLVKMFVSLTFIKD